MSGAAGRKAKQKRNGDGGGCPLCPRREAVGDRLLDCETCQVELAHLAHLMSPAEQERIRNAASPLTLYHGGAVGHRVGDLLSPSEADMRDGWFDYMSPRGLLVCTPEPADASRHTIYWQPPGAVYRVIPTGEVEPEWEFNMLRELMRKKTLPPRWLAAEVRVEEVIGDGVSAHTRGGLELLYREVARRRPKHDHDKMLSLAEQLRKRGPRFGLESEFIRLFSAACELTALRDGPKGELILRELAKHLATLNGETGR